MKLSSDSRAARVIVILIAAAVGLSLLAPVFTQSGGHP